MAANPRVVAEDAEFTWDGVPQRLPKGAVIDVPPGSHLERAIGAGRLVPVHQPGSTALPPEPPAEEPLSAAGRKKAAGKDTAGSKEDGK